MTSTTEATPGTTTSVTTQIHRVYIKASPQAIWDAITSSEWTTRYGYAGPVDYDLRPGGAYTAYTSDAMRAMGSPDIAVDGEVLESDPPRRLVQTWRMLMDEEMAAEGFTKLTYDIEEGSGGICKLTLTHELEGAPRLAVIVGGFAGAGAGGGWIWVLSSLKSLLETGEELEYQMA